MVEKSLKDFLSNIAPYLKLWAGFRVSEAAVNLDGAWLNLAIRGEFLESSPARNEMHSPEPHFLHYMVEFPLDVMEAVIRRIVLEGFFELGSGDSAAYARVLMKRERENTNNVQAGPVQWSGPFIREASRRRNKTEAHEYDSGRIRSSVQEVLPYEMSRKIEANLSRCCHGRRPQMSPLNDRLDSNQAVSSPRSSLHALADELALLRPHMPLSQCAKLRAQAVQCVPNPPLSSQQLSCEPERNHPS